MSFLQKTTYKKTTSNKKAEIIAKEAFRKLIHILGSLTPFLASISSAGLVILSLSIITVLYSISELLRLMGYNIYIISRIVSFANRKRDEKRFSLGPVTLSLGIIISLYFFPLYIATISIFALSFGDGLASLIGRMFGKKKCIFRCKTCVGSLTCFVATLIAVFLFTHLFIFSIVIALITTIVELLPLKDLDNIAIPLTIALIIKYCLFALLV